MERREDSGTDYATIGTMSNTSSHAVGKIKLRDKSTVPGIAYRYRVVVNCEGGENTGEYILRDGKAKTIPFLRYDYKFEGTPTADGITISWPPVVWDAHEYRVTRQSDVPGESPIAIGTVSHDASARRLTLTDTTATASGTYRYFFLGIISNFSNRLRREPCSLICDRTGGTRTAPSSGSQVGGLSAWGIVKIEYKSLLFPIQS